MVIHLASSASAANIHTRAFWFGARMLLNDHGVLCPHHCSHQQLIQFTKAQGIIQITWHAYELAYLWGLLWAKKRFMAVQKVTMVLFGGAQYR